MDCFPINSGNIDGRIDPNPYHPERLNALTEIRTSKFEIKPLKEIVEFRKTAVNRKEDGEIYVGLENIESNTCTFLPSDVEVETFDSAFKFTKGDILFSKLRPYLNKVYLADFDGVCSTEFYVLSNAKCDSRYLASFLSSKIVLKQTIHLMTGNTLPRLQTSAVEDLLVPIPNSDRQTEVASKFNEALNLKREKDSEAAQLFKLANDVINEEVGIKIEEFRNYVTTTANSEIVKKRFLPMYFQPKYIFAENAIRGSKYEVKTLGSISKLISDGPGGWSLHVSDYVEEGIPLIRVTNMKNGKLNKNNLVFISEKKHQELLRSEVKIGDLLLSMRGTIGLSTVVDWDYEKANINAAVCRIRVKEGVCPEYVSIFFNSKIGRLQTERESYKAVQNDLNLPIIRDLSIILPSYSKQKLISEKVRQGMEKGLALQAEAINKYNEILNEIQTCFLR
jgi:type I restriction enzyme, S subunit